MAIQFGDAPLTSCEGTIPTQDGPVKLDWRKTANKLEYRLDMPEGYQATITDHSGLQLVEKKQPMLRVIFSKRSSGE